MAELDTWEKGEDGIIQMSVENNKLTSTLVPLLVKTPVVDNETGEMTNMIMKDMIIWMCDISDCCVPDKLFADGAEGRLREERGTELVTFDNVNFCLLHGASPLMEGEQTLSLMFRLRVSLSLTCGV